MSLISLKVQRWTWLHPSVCITACIHGVRQLPQCSLSCLPKNRTNAIFNSTFIFYLKYHNIVKRRNTKTWYSSVKDQRCAVQTHWHGQTIFHLFICAASATWNSLPPAAINCDTLCVFKSRLKNHLFNAYLFNLTCSASVSKAASLWRSTNVFIIIAIIYVHSAADNATCSSRCWVQPCWGPGDDQCVNCPQYRHNVTRVCLQSCDEEPRLYADDSAAQKQCRPCDPQCLNSCNGPVYAAFVLSHRTLLTIKQ